MNKQEKEQLAALSLKMKAIAAEMNYALTPKPKAPAKFMVGAEQHGWTLLRNLIPPKGEYLVIYRNSVAGKWYFGFHLFDLENECFEANGGFSGVPGMEVLAWKEVSSISAEDMACELMASQCNGVANE